MRSLRSRLIPLVSAFLLVACGDDGGSSGPGPQAMPDGGVDRSTSGRLSLDEGGITAQFDADGLHLNLPLTISGGTASGRASVQVIRLEDNTVLSRMASDFRDEEAITLPFHFTDLPDLTIDATLADLVIEYEILARKDRLWGRRSLFTATPMTEVQVLGQDTLRVGVQSHLRVIARDPRSGQAQEKLPVEVIFTPEAAEDQPVEPVVLFAGETDEAGLLTALIEPDEAQAGSGALAVRVAAPEGDQAIEKGVAIERATRILLTTDKPLYQPGQIIHLRSLALNRPDLEPAGGVPVTFEIHDAKDNVLDRIVEESDEFGIAATTFQIASQVNMGAWRLITTVGESTTEKVITVDRYALPKYDVRLEHDKPVYLAGDRLLGTVHARYFFGRPVADAQVRVEAATHDVARTVFAELNGRTNEDGLFQFEVPLPDYIVGLPLEQGGGLVELALEITDTAGQQRTAARTIRVAKAPVEQIVVPEAGIWVKGLRNRLLIRALDASGTPYAGRHSLVANGAPEIQFETDESGLAEVEVVGDPADGQAATVQMTTYDGDQEITNEFTFEIGGAPTGAVLIRPVQALYTVGDELQADIFTIGAPDRVYIDVIRAGQTVLTRSVSPDDEGQARLKLDLGHDLTGSLRIEAWYLAQGSSLMRDAADVYVDPASDLTVTFSNDQDSYRPGEEAVISVEVTDGEGVGRPTALGLQIVDEAVFSLVEMRPGLEKLYFQLESLLGEPRYQIGIPSLATLARDPDAADDPVRQAEARLLFAAAGAAGGFGFDVNTWRQAIHAVRVRITPGVQRAGEAYVDWLIAGLPARDEALQQIAERLANARPYGDPWGQPFEITLDGTHLTLASIGPDEVARTTDDVKVQFNLYSKLYRNDEAFADGPQAGGDFDQAEGRGNNAGGPEDPAPPNAGPEDDGEEGGGVRVRRDFPETLFVEPALITDGDGHAEFKVPLADSITTWRLSAMAHTASGQLGSTDHGITVFQPFFVDIDFPAALTRGDAYEVPIALYNYLDTPQEVRLEIPEVDWMRIEGPREIVVQLEAGEVRGIRLPVEVERVGLHELLVIARGEEMQDAVARSVRVEPDGQKVESVARGRLDGPITREVTMPAEAVEGSGTLLVRLYPGLMSAVVEGLDGLLRMPSGCFEQTSSTTWPNVLVARYYRDSGGNPEIEAQAMQFIHTGYQRLLTFEVQGGGFEWFGQTPAHDVLTAYGLLEFADMAEVRPVDAAMIDRTRAWLLGRQQADGHWENAQRGLDETGNLTDPVTVTAYVAFGLAASGARAPELDRARTYLAARRGEMGTYTLALFANFLVAMDPDDALTRQVLGDLAAAVEQRVEGDAPEAPHWRTDEQTTTYGQGEPAWIETTALATHALLVSGQHLGTAQEALAWLLDHKDPSGAWGSTAGTVWTIKCLLAAMRGGQDQEANATVRVTYNGEEQGRFNITPQTSDVMRQVDLSTFMVPGRVGEVGLTMEGEGNLQYAVVQSHHLPWEVAPPAEGPLSISVEYDRTNLAVEDTVTATVRVQNNDQAFADMVMVDLGLPPGFDLVTDDLDALVTQGVFSRYERTQRQLLLYFTVIQPGPPVEFSYRLVARDPVRAQAPPSRVYSYYNPEVGAEALPVEFEVE